MKEILVLNSGGTFNKTYNELNGKLEIEKNCNYLEEIIFKCFKNNLNIKLEGLVYKDSLELKEEDRKILLLRLKKSKKSILIHGTDTMDISAEFFSKEIKDEVIVISGAMIPYSIDKIEAVANLSLAVQFVQTCKEPGVYIAMHGLVKPYSKLIKNRELGKFDCIK